MSELLPKRKNPRLSQFDYSSPGAYFITICTKDKKQMLSNIVGAIHESPETKLTEFGKIVEHAVKRVPTRYNVILDRYVIMPNHIHLIIVITENGFQRAIRESPLRSPTISKMVGFIKMTSSKEIHEQFGYTEIWQRSFHDHIIRDRWDYAQIARYIAENPLRWTDDCFYPTET